MGSSFTSSVCRSATCVNTRVMPLGKRTITLSATVASPAPKCSSNGLWPLKLFCADASCTKRRDTPPIVARIHTLAPIAERFDVLPTQRTLSHAFVAGESLR